MYRFGNVELYPVKVALPRDVIERLARRALFGVFYEQLRALLVEFIYVTQLVALYFEYGAMYTRIYPNDFEEAA